MTVLEFKKPANDDRGVKPPPMFNIPPLTMGVLIAIVLVQVVQTVLPEPYQRLFYDFAFVPRRYTDPQFLDVYAFLSPFTHIFMHGGWLHVAMNGLMFLAFGAAAERMLGTKSASVLFIVCGLAGAFVQFLISPHSPFPMVGASGALSGLFAAVIMRMQQTGAMPAGKWGIWGIAALWIGLSFFTALVGGSVGLGNVAWAAHAGGFLGGVAMMKYVYKS